MDKLRPTYDLDAIKAAIGSVDTLAMTTTALRDASELGFDRAAVVEVIAGIDRKMFVKSMTPSPIIAFGRTSITCRLAI